MPNFNFTKCATIFICCLGLSAISTTTISAQRIYALSGNNLAWFDATSPGGGGMVAAISGIAAGQVLSGIDYRPQTGELYGIGYNSATGEARLYTINTASGAATPIGAAAITVAANMGDITFDFNPTVDRIRFMGSNNQNYRLHPVTGAIAATDGNLAFAAADVNAVQDPEIGTGAYSNSFIASTATVLYNYDTKLNIFTTQNPPNNGTQNTIGASGIAVNPADPSADLDIFFNSVTGTNTAFLAANIGGSTNDNLYSVDLSTGQTTLLGSTGMALRDIAVQITRVVPNLVGDLLYGLTSNNWLVSFDAMNPNVIRTSAPITGVATGQVLSGMDFRPATGELYALGYNSATGEARLYTINYSTAVATAVGTAPIALPANLGKIGLDFNPTVDRIRVTTSSNANYRLHPTTGAIAATDLNLNFAAGDVNFGKNPSIGAVAYTNSFAGATTTTLYNYDDSLNVLTTQAPPNDGKLNTVGASGIVVNLADPTTDLDVFYDKIAAANRAYLVANVGTSGFDNLYTLNLTTGAATSVGKIGSGSAISDVSAFISPRVAVVCPANQTLVPPVGSATVVANYILPVGASGCLTGLNAPIKTSGLASGSAFPGGVNTVCYSASDNCGNTGSCCFTVTVSEVPCDVKTIGCLKFEMLSVRPNTKGDKIMRVRVTNNCTSALSYVAFQVQNGTTAVSPADGSTFSAASGNKYLVRSPNFSPFYSIRFKTTGAGIKSGGNDIFEYTLPKVTGLNNFHVVARTDDGNYFEWYLNIYKCSPNLKPAGDGDDTQFEIFETEQIATARTSKNDWNLYPNPSSGKFLVDLSSFGGSRAELAVYDVSGQLMARQLIENVSEEEYDFSEITQSWANGIYFVEILAANGERKMMRWTLQR